MKRLLTMFLSLLFFSVMTANNVRFDDSKDVTKQKTEVSNVMSQDIQINTTLEVYDFTILSTSSEVAVMLEANSNLDKSPVITNEDVGWRSSQKYNIKINNTIAGKNFLKSKHLQSNYFSRQTYSYRC